MKELNFRTLTPDEIDVRVDQVISTDKFIGCRVLLYKDARVDMNLLDEVVKPLNWKREHCRDNANCVVSIWDSEKKEWISKEDTGSESNQDAAKGLASDSFKRACVNWGIGRELYSAPKAMLISLNKGEVREKNNKLYVAGNVRFFVKEIGYDDKRNINHLVIINQDGDDVYTFDKDSQSKTKKSSKKADAQPKAEKPAEEPKQAQNPVPTQQPTPAPEVEHKLPELKLTKEEEDLYLQICADLENADKTSSVLATCLMAEKQPYELHIRKAAAKRGIDLATTRAEVTQAYNLIKDREPRWCWEEEQIHAINTVKSKGLK